MTKYATGNPVGSSDPRDLIDNAGSLDEAVVSENTTFKDRLGNTRLTIKGMEQVFDGGQPAIDAYYNAIEEADRAAAQAAKAETARDATFANADVYADIATGRGAVADGEQFVVVQGSEIVRYRRDTSSTQTEMARYPTSGAVATKASADEVIRVRSYTTKNSLEGADQKAQLSPNASPAGPETLFGAGLVSYFGPWSPKLLASGQSAPLNEPIAEVVGAGDMSIFTGAGASTGSLYRYTFSQGSPVYGLKSSVGGEPIVLNPPAGAGAAWLAGPRPMLFLCWDGGLAFDSPGETILFQLGNMRIDGYQKKNPSIGNRFTVRLLVDSVVRYEWDSIGDYVQETSASGGLATLQGYNATRLALSWPRDSVEPRLILNGRETPPITAQPIDINSIVAGDITVGPLLRCYAVAIASDHSEGDWERLHEWHDQPTVSRNSLRDLDVQDGATSSAEKVQPRHRGWPIPATIDGPYKRVADLAINTDVVGTLPVPTIPAGPNIAPWSVETHDRTITDASVGRFNIIEHPDYPGDTTKAMLQTGANFAVAPGVYTVASTLLECMDTTVTNEVWTRIPLDRYARHASANTSVTNNLNAPMTPLTFGRILDMTPWWPDGYPIAGYGNYKYLFLDEYGPTGQEAIIYGTNDPREPFETWARLVTREHCWPHKYGVGSDDYLAYHGDIRDAQPWERPKRRVEEKAFNYDPTSNRFFRFTREWGTSYPIPPAGPGNAVQNARNMYIAWSREGDPTRWPKNMLQPLVLSPHLGYQCYDIGMVKQLRTDMWLLPVHSYTDWLAGTTGGVPNEPDPSLINADKNLQTWTDIYVSYDQLKSPPILVRAGFTLAGTPDEDWDGGFSLVDFAHPTRDCMYLIGGRRRHNSGDYQPDFELKPSKIAYTFPENIVADRAICDGWVSTDPIDGANVDQIRVEAKGGVGMVRGRIKDAATGRVIPGYDLHDSYTDESGVMMWRFTTYIPRTMVVIEVELRGAEFSGIYPVMRS